MAPVRTQARGSGHLLASALNSAAQRKKRKFQPFQAPTAPAAGQYDPVLDQQLGAATRGYHDLQADIGYDPVTGAATGTQSQRAENDYSIAGNRIAQQAGYNLQDYLTNRATVDRNYTNLGDAQTQSANAAGLLGGGYAEQASAKRAANRNLELTGLDVAKKRADTGTDQATGALGLDYGRGVEDRNTQLARAGREFQQFRLDTGQSRFYQASANGYVPPSRPQGEHASHGVVYRDLGNGHYVLPNGQVVNKNSLARLLARHSSTAVGTGTIG